MGKIFISYRRNDSQHITDRVYDRLIKIYGYDNVFKDVDSIQIGKNFIDVIKGALLKTDVFLVIIGVNWIGKLDDGTIRIDTKDDFVRVELEEAIKLNLKIIPIFVNGAVMPEKLPKSIESLRHINALNIRPDPDFSHDIERLFKVLPKKKKAVWSKWFYLPILILAITIFLFLSKVKIKKIRVEPVSKSTKVVDSSALMSEIDSNKLKDEYYVHGELKRKYFYKNNKLVSSTEYYKSGNEKFIYPYGDNEKINGVVKGYFDNKEKILESKYYYKNGKSGKYEKYKRDGRIKESGVYINNRLIPSCSYYASGKINHKNIYKDDKLSKEITYYENGNIFSETLYNSNEIKIKHTTYTLLGKKKKEIIYLDNNKKIHEYDKLGNLLTIAYWENNILKKREYYYPNGSLKSLYPFIDKKDMNGISHYIFHGKVKFYKSDGTLRKEIIYNYGDVVSSVYY